MPGERPPVLFFPGGHCSATCDCGWSVYSELGHAIVSFSRPGYGATRVGRRSAADFAPLVREVCCNLGITVIAAAVGVSFGGLQAIHVAEDQELRVPRLVLHSCAPSGLSYPDSPACDCLLPTPAGPRLVARAPPGALGCGASTHDGAALETSCRGLVGSSERRRTG